jgi:hypothetical protein
MQNWLKLGDYNVICDSCGRKYKASTMRKRWDGLLVCKEDYEIKHPQLSMKVRGDKQTVPIPRPEAADQFLEFCDLWKSSPMAGFGTADCATVGGNTSIAILIDVFSPNAIAGYAIAGRSISGVLHT